MKKRLLYLLFSCCLLCLILFPLSSCNSEGGEWNPPMLDGDGSEENVGQVYWDTTDIVFQLTENTNSDNFSPTQRRFLAGEDETHTPNNIDKIVAQRNETVYSIANVNLIYDYCPNMYSHGWGRNADRIISETLSDAPGSPDMYCNFVYDMTAASLRGAFANLYSTDRCKNGDALTLEMDDGTKYDAQQLGYLLEYMKTFTLSDDKMYLLASDYTIDLIRSMLIVPVNVDMLNAIPLASSTGDTGVMDGTFDISDLYNLVWKGGFTYDALATLAEAVYEPTSDLNVGADLGDVLGFAINPSYSDVATGFFYAKDLNMVNIDKNSDGYTITYPETNKNFEDFCAALAKLVDSRGVYVAQTVHDDRIIEDRFTSGNNILFSSIMPLYELEGPNYQRMMDQNKLGIVPIPVYKKDKNNFVPYNTVFGENACVVAISNSTTSFDQCSLFFKLQSLKSAQLIPTYFEEYFSFDLESALAYSSYNNTKMLHYIMRSIGPGGFLANIEFDTIFPREIDICDSDEYYNTWPRIIRINNYKITNPTTVYKYATEEKSPLFDDALEKWNKLK